MFDPRTTSKKGRNIFHVKQVVNIRSTVKGVFTREHKPPARFCQERCTMLLSFIGQPGYHCFIESVLVDHIFCLSLKTRKMQACTPGIPDAESCSSVGFCDVSFSRPPTQSSRHQQLIPLRQYGREERQTKLLALFVYICGRKTLSYFATQTCLSSAQYLAKTVELHQAVLV